MSRAALLLGSGLLAVAMACSEAAPEIVIVLETNVPSVTSELSLEISGTAVRSPSDAGVSLTVTVTGGAAEVSTVANLHGLFSLDVPLLPNATNELVFVANDGLGNSSRPARRTVVQQAAAAGSDRP